MIASYRDPRYAASLRIEQIRAQRGEELEQLPREWTLVHARRVARSWAGGVAVAGFVAMVVSTIVLALREHPRSGGLRPTYVLVAAVVASIVTYFVARVAAAKRFPRRVRARFDDSGDALARLARLEAGSIRGEALRIARGGEMWGLALPIAGIGLLAPLWMHLVVWSVVEDKSTFRLFVSSFDDWIAVSLVLVGLAHAALASLGVVFARRVARCSTSILELGSPLGGWAALGWTVVAACVPGIIALAIPPVLVFVTGACFVPMMFNRLYRNALAERHTLDIE